MTLDFGSLGSQIESVERIDLESDGGNSTLNLNLTDVLSLSENSNELSILGDAGDAVNLNNTSNGQTGVWSNTGSAGGVGTYVFTSGGDVLATVLIDDSITTSVI